MERSPAPVSKWEARGLARNACPPLAEIAVQAGFEPREISREGFEAVWLRYAG